MPLAGAPRCAKAQWTVFDPTNCSNAVLRYAQLRNQLAQLQATYNQIVNQYNLAVRMATNLPNMANRYAASWAPWRFASAQDQYGNTTTWIDGVNTGVLARVLAGYERATNALQTYLPSDIANMSPPERERVQSHYATVELTDGANHNAMQTMGAIRANAVATAAALNNLESDSLSNNPNLNTEVSVLNKVNATTMLALQNAQDTNKLLVALLEQQTIAAKQQRDAQANAINNDIYRRANIQPAIQQVTAGFNATLNSYRLP